MPNLSTGINLDSNFLNLKEIEIKEVRPEIEKLLVENEKIMCAFKTIRDQVIFTNSRINKCKRSYRQKNCIFFISIFKNTILRNWNSRIYGHRQWINNYI